MHVEDGDEPGMHRTDSTDFGVVLSGNVALELDDGVEVLLSPGDVVVQNGTRHRWRVVGNVPAQWLLSLSEPTAVNSPCRQSLLLAEDSRGHMLPDRESAVRPPAKGHHNYMTMTI